MTLVLQDYMDAFWRAMVFAQLGDGMLCCQLAGGTIIQPNFLLAATEETTGPATLVFCKRWHHWSATRWQPQCNLAHITSPGTIAFLVVLNVQVASNQHGKKCCGQFDAAALQVRTACS
jgi:hypothetical protein